MGKNQNKYSMQNVQVYMGKTWGKRIGDRNTKLHQKFKENQKFFQERKLKNTFSAFIKPCIEYATLVWGVAPKIHLLKTDRIIHKSIRTMLFKNKFESVKPLYKYLNILSLNNTIKLMRGKFMWELSIRNISEVYKVNSL